ncbi:hypothetical protein Tco_0927661 [Tanacetum coccineum]
MHNNPSSRGRMLEDQMWPEPIWLVVMKVVFMLDLTLFATSASYTMLGHARVKRSPVENQRSAHIFELRRKRHFKKDFPKLKNQNHGNKPVIPEARGKAYAIGGGDANPGSNVVTDVSYAVELADGRIVKTNTLSNNHAVIICDEKIVRIPFGDEILIVQGDRSDKGKKSTLSIISCTKTQKYMEKGCQVFLAQVTKKETEVKSQEKRLEDVPIV